MIFENEFETNTFLHYHFFDGIKSIYLWFPLFGPLFIQLRMHEPNKLSKRFIMEQPS